MEWCSDEMACKISLCWYTAALHMRHCPVPTYIVGQVYWRSKFKQQPHTLCMACDWEPYLFSQSLPVHVGVANTL